MPAVPQRGLRAAELVVVCIEDVNVRVGGEVRVEGKPEQASIPEVVDVGAQVGKGGRGGV
jgi:hypothetical protein